MSNLDTFFTVVSQYRKAYARLHDLASDLAESEYRRDGETESLRRRLADQLAGPCNRADDALTKALKARPKAKAAALVDALEAALQEVEFDIEHGEPDPARKRTARKARRAIDNA